MGVCHSSLPESTHVQSVNMLQGQEPVTDRDTLLCEFSKIAENGAFLFYKGVDGAVLVKHAFPAHILYKPPCILYSIAKREEGQV